MQSIGNRYYIEEELGEGGMGTVYKGKDSQTGATVAIKRLKPQVNSSELIERFKREGEALRALKHPNIVQLLDTVQETDAHYLIMEYVAGGDLSQKLEKGALPLKELLPLAIDLCDALTRAHKLDIIHRDLKPANILIADDGTVRLTDFGVAHFGSKQRVTQTDSIMGTFDYLAPEIFGSSEIDKRSDIWAVGVILFEMLTGQRPFEAATIIQTINNVVAKDIPDIEELCPDAPTALVDLVYRILNRNPDERIPSIRLVGAELEAISVDNPLTPTTSTRNFEIVIGAFQTTPIPNLKDNLPSPSTPFVGREIDLAAVNSLLRDPNIRLLSILAQGGMGKTRLSIEAAKSLRDMYPQGVYFVELAPLATAEDIPSAIAEAVNYPFKGGNPKEQIVAYFRDKTCLLVLDNFEHVLEGRDIVQAILQNSQTKFLVTSRERLNLSGETLYQLEGMDFPNWESPTDAMQYAAVRLFVDSAKRVRSNFELTAEDLPFAARICGLVQGLPLGIVLAASWLDALSIEEIATEIAKNVDFLESNMHDLPERQRSIRAVFDYSWGMLSEDEKQAFARLAVFRGGMSREAAQAVSETNLRSLQTLVNKSLLRRDNATGRFEIHELLRQYGDEFLQKTGVYESILAKHAAYYAEFLAKRDVDLKGKRQIPALQEIDADFENIKSAWRWGVQQRAASFISQMIESIYWYCIFRNRNMEGQELFSLAREQCEEDSLIASRVKMRFPEQQSDYTELYQGTLALAKKHESKAETAFALRQLGHWQSHSQQKPEGIDRMEEAAAIWESLGDKFHLAIVLDDLAWSYRFSGRPEQQLATVERSVALRREINDKIGLANALRNLGGALGGMGSGRIEPLHKWEEALQLSKEIDDKRNIAWNSYMVSLFWQFDGEFEKSRPFRQQAFEVASEVKEDIVRKLCIISDGIDAIVLEEDYARGKQLIDEAYPPNSPNDFRAIISSTGRAYLSLASNDYEYLKGMAMALHKMGQNVVHPIIVLPIFLSLSQLVRDGAYEKAAEWMGFFETSAPSRMAKRWAWYQRFRADLVVKLGQVSFDAALARGAKREMFELADEAVAYIESH
jgi:serine/threonine protein kinase/tetratricopeptide (TPR) repeat protein